MTHRPRRAGLAAGASLSLLALLLSGCSDDPDPQLRVVDDARPDAAAGATQVQVPTGQVSVGIGAPVEEVPAADGSGEDPLAAGDGEVWVPLTLTDEARAGVPGLALLLLADVETVPQVTLSAGEESLDLGTASGIGSAPTLSTQPFYVAVPEDALDTLAVEVEFDDVVQTVTADGELDPGSAEALYDDAPARSVDCRDGWLVEGAPEAQAAVDCAATSLSWPWSPDRGWATDGTSWGFVVLDASVLQVRLGDGPRAETCGRDTEVDEVVLEVGDTTTAPAADLPVSPGSAVGFGWDGESWPSVGARVTGTCQVGEQGFTLTRDLVLPPR